MSAGLFPPETNFHWPFDLDFSKFSYAKIKTLGIIWNPKEDKLQGRATPYEQEAVRKRIERARCPLSPAEPTAIQLHIFSDASEVAYVCTVCKIASGTLRKKQLPRLELCDPRGSRQ